MNQTPTAARMAKAKPQCARPDDDERLRRRLQHVERGGFEMLERSRIVAAIGPCIARTSYEVDDGFFRRFAEADPANERFFTDGVRAGHHQFDIEAYVTARIAGAGIGRVEALGLDTYAHADRFYSFRRATHRGEPGYGRQVSLIGLA